MEKVHTQACWLCTHLQTVTMCVLSMQHFGAPEAGPGASMRSGRISKLTQRFSQYKSHCSDVEGSSASPQMECDADLVDVVAALCDLGQQHNM